MATNTTFPMSRNFNNRLNLTDINTSTMPGAMSISPSNVTNTRSILKNPPATARDFSQIKDYQPLDQTSMVSGNSKQNLSPMGVKPFKTVYG